MLISLQTILRYVLANYSLHLHYRWMVKIRMHINKNLKCTWMLTLGIDKLGRFSNSKWIAFLLWKCSSSFLLHFFLSSFTLVLFSPSKLPHPLNKSATILRRFSLLLLCPLDMCVCIYISVIQKWMSCFLCLTV